MIEDPVILKMENVLAIKTSMDLIANLRNVKMNVMEEEIVLKRKEFVHVNSDLKEMIVVLSPVLINAVEMGLV